MNVIGAGISVNNIVNDYDKKGNGIKDINSWDIADATGGTIATGSGFVRY